MGQVESRTQFGLHSQKLSFEHAVDFARHCKQKDIHGESFLYRLLFNLFKSEQLSLLS